MKSLPTKITLLCLFFIIALHLFLLSKTIFFPYPELFVYPYLTNSGLLPYRDILDQHFPGLMFLPLNLYNLGMQSPGDARLWQLGIVLITHLFLFFSANKIFNSEKKALITNIFYLLLQPLFEGWVLWIDSFIPLMTLPAFLFLHNFFKGKSPSNLFLSGLFLGVALVFKQVMLPVILVIFIYLLMKRIGLKNLFVFSIGSLIPFSLIILYILKIEVWKEFLFWTVEFNLGTFALMGRKYAETKELLKTVFVFGIPIVISIVGFIKNKSEKTILLWLFFFTSLVFIFARFDYVHLQPAIPFSALILASLFQKRSKLLMVTISIYLIVIFSLSFKFYKSHFGDKVFFFGEFESKLIQIVKSNTTEEDKIFAFGTTPHIYFLTNRLPAGNIFIFHFPWFLVEAEDELLEKMVKDPPKLIIRDKNSEVSGKNLVSYGPKLSNYIDMYYKEIERVDGIEILTRN